MELYIWLTTFVWIPLGCLPLFLFNGYDNILLRHQISACPLKYSRAIVNCMYIIVIQLSFSCFQSILIFAFFSIFLFQSLFIYLFFFSFFLSSFLPFFLYFFFHPFSLSYIGCPTLLNPGGLGFYICILANAFPSKW